MDHYASIKSLTEKFLKENFNKYNLKSIYLYGTFINGKIDTVYNDLTLLYVLDDWSDMKSPEYVDLLKGLTLCLKEILVCDLKVSVLAIDEFISCFSIAELNKFFLTSERIYGYNIFNLLSKEYFLYKSSEFKKSLHEDALKRTCIVRSILLDINLISNKQKLQEFSKYIILLFRDLIFFYQNIYLYDEYLLYDYLHILDEYDRKLVKNILNIKLKNMEISNFSYYDLLEFVENKTFLLKQGYLQNISS